MNHPTLRKAVGVTAAAALAALACTATASSASPARTSSIARIRHCGEIVERGQPWRQYVDGTEHAWGEDWNVGWAPTRTNVRPGSANCTAAKRFARAAIGSVLEPRGCFADDESAWSTNHSSEVFWPFHMIQCVRRGHWTITVIANTFFRNVHFVG
jgi:hypothetical protein